MKEKNCIRCKDKFMPGSNRQLLCKPCSKEAKEHKIEPIPKILGRQGTSKINTEEDLMASEFPDIAEDSEHSEGPIVQKIKNPARTYIELPFAINDRVMILDIDQPGRIAKIILDGRNVLFEIYYWWEGQLKFVNLDETEIKLKETGNKFDHELNGKELKRWKN